MTGGRAVRRFVHQPGKGKGALLGAICALYPSSLGAGFPLNIAFLRAGKARPPAHANKVQ
jgi:hypothetical protein